MESTTCSRNNQPLVVFVLNITKISMLVDSCWEIRVVGIFSIVWILMFELGSRHHGAVAYNVVVVILMSMSDICLFCFFNLS